MQYQQPPPQQVVVKEKKKNRGCLTAWLVKYSLARRRKTLISISLKHCDTLLLLPVRGILRVLLWYVRHEPWTNGSMIFITFTSQSLPG